MKDKGVDIGRIQGFVEIIVRDKHGRVKVHIGRPPFVKLPMMKKKKNNPHSLPIMSSLPAKTIDLEYWRKNIITNVGLAEIVRLVFSGLTGTKFGYLAIGTGTTAESASDTALEAEIARKSASVSQTTTTITDDTALLEATFSSADGLSGTHAVSEAGIFNAASGGVLLARKTFSAVNVNWDAGDSLTIRYYVQFTR
ncbi:MAG: hypothetical protein NDF55_10800 [archaeon GB-1867-005]|nr:hypothetical protein [Candidatus Culexmicrobium cathedralense]